MSHNDDLLKIFLGLSNGVPLFTIPGTHASENELQPETFSLLAPKASRIRSLHLRLSTTLL